MIITVPGIILVFAGTARGGVIVVPEDGGVVGGEVVSGTEVDHGARSVETRDLRHRRIAPVILRLSERE
jgi:hypothetical protein